MAIFDDFDWGDVVKSVAPIIPAAVSGYIGARNAADANRQAADAIRTGQEQGVRSIQLSNADAINSIQQGNAEARNTLTGLQQRVGEIAGPGTSHLRGILAVNPAMLTPAQQVELGDAQRTWGNQIQRQAGSGRAMVAMQNDLTNRTKARMIDENRRRADSAATTLHGLNASTLPAVASGISSIQMGEGRDVGAVMRNSGAAAAQGAANIGEAEAGAGIANAEASNSALQTITGVIAADEERKRRESRYKDWSQPRA